MQDSKSPRSRLITNSNHFNALTWTLLNHKNTVQKQNATSKLSKREFELAIINCFLSSWPKWWQNISYELSQEAQFFLAKQEFSEYNSPRMFLHQKYFYYAKIASTQLAHTFKLTMNQIWTKISTTIECSIVFTFDTIIIVKEDTNSSIS